MVKSMFIALCLYLLVILAGFTWAFWPQEADCADNCVQATCSPTVPCPWAECACVGAGPNTLGRCVRVAW